MSTPDLRERIEHAVTDLVDGRDVIVLATALAGAVPMVESVIRHGARMVLVLGLVRGTGPLPSGPSVTCTQLDLGTMTSTADEIVQTNCLVQDPPADVRNRVETFDPDGRAVVVINGFSGRSRDYLGRSTVGGRPMAFETLEDKTLSRDLWAACGVVSAPESVSPCRGEALQDSASRLDHGHGTVWSADASEGMNGGADRVFRVRDEAEARAAYDILRTVSRQVRVMPFLEGVPCSIHGVVLPDGVAVLRPVELLVLRRPGSAKFVYSGISTGWDPSAADREQMREVARRVGTHLAHSHGYRGGFGVDGILTEEGFRPTELNPRFTGGLNMIAKGLPDLPMRWLHDLVIGPHTLEVSAAEVEELLLPAADAHRYGAVYTMTEEARALETTSVLVTGDENGLDITDREGDSVGRLERGPGAHGDLVRFTPHQVAPGMRLAPWAVPAFRLADRLWHTGIGNLDYAPDVRTDLPG